MKVKITATLELDETWSSNFPPEEIRELVGERLVSSMGFRLGRIKRLKVESVKERGAGQDTTYQQHKK